MILRNLKAGNMVDNRAYVWANNLTDGALKLEVFRPNLLTMPDNDHPLRTMLEVQRAFSFYMALVRRQRLWDHTPEILLDYLIEAEWFSPENKPFSGFYRRPAHPPHAAVHTLILAAHRALVQSLVISSGAITYNTIDEIHHQRCSEEPGNWSLSPLAAPARKEKAPTKKKPAASTSANDLKTRIKRAICDSGENLCISYNLGIACLRPPSATGCSFCKSGQTTDVAHTCAFLLPTGARCSAPHCWKGHHL